MKKNFFKATTLAIVFVICFCVLGTVLGAEQSRVTDVNVASDTEWKIMIGGMVNNAFNLTLSQIVAMPGTKVNADLYCFDILVVAGGWYGVRLGAILEKAGLHDGVEYIQFVASDGYATFLDTSTAMRDDVILAYELNGQPLPETIRLVIPDENGDKWIALITQITAVTAPVSVPAQPNLTPTLFPEAGKSQTASSPQPNDESTQTNNESNVPPVVLPPQAPENSTLQPQELLHASAPAVKTTEPEPTTSEPREPTHTQPEPIMPKPTTPEPTEPETTKPTAEPPLITTELAIIAAVTVACIVGTVSFWALRNRK